MDAAAGDVVARGSIGFITAADELSLAALTLEFNPDHLFGGESSAVRRKIVLSPVRVGDWPVCTAVREDRGAEPDEIVLAPTVTDSRGRLPAEGEAVFGP